MLAGGRWKVGKAAAGKLLRGVGGRCGGSGHEAEAAGVGFRPEVEHFVHVGGLLPGAAGPYRDAGRRGAKPSFLTRTLSLAAVGCARQGRPGPPADPTLGSGQEVHLADLSVQLPAPPPSEFP